MVSLPKGIAFSICISGKVWFEYVVIIHQIDHKSSKRRV
jgi:hypothetical protein